MWNVQAQLLNTFLFLNMFDLGNINPVFTEEQSEVCQYGTIAPFIGNVLY